MSTMTVKNESGQVASFGLTGPDDPRKVILDQRVARGELTVVDASEVSETVVVRHRREVIDADTGQVDEKGDLLKSVHGGGLDPDARGDVLGQPTGSGRSATRARGDRKVAEKYVERTETVETEVKTTPAATSA